MNTSTVICECVALYDYTADAADNHLQLKSGDKISVYTQEPSGWWSGMKVNDGTIGWFPASFVELLSSAPSKPASPINASPISNTVASWEHHYTDNGEVYYVNSATGESSWTCPENMNGSNPSTANITRSSSSVALDDNWDAVPIGLTTSNTPNSSVESFDDQVVESLSRTSISKEKISKNSARRTSAAVSTVSSKSSKLPHISENLSFADPNPVPVAINGRYGYVNNFWSDKDGKSGFDILVSKHRNGKEVCKDIASFMYERAKIEETYAKSLLELAKGTLGDTESGTAKTAWNQLKFDVKTQAQSRLDFSQKLMKDVYQPVMNFKNEQKKMRKNYEATMSADRKAMITKYANAQRMRKMYLTKAKEAEAADSILQAFSESPANTANRRDYLKAEETSKRERKKESIAQYDYTTAVDDYERVRIRWEEDMQTASQEFQHAEEERLEFLSTLLQSYLTVQKQVNDCCKESSEMVENSIVSVSKEVDIEMFVKQHFTGGYRPPPLKFEQYEGRN